MYHYGTYQTKNWFNLRKVEFDKGRSARPMNKHSEARLKMLSNNDMKRRYGVIVTGSSTEIKYEKAFCDWCIEW